MDEKGFKKTCIKEKKKRGGVHQRLCGTLVADFMLRQDAGRFMLGRYLSDKNNPDSKHLQNIPALVHSEDSAAKETIGDGCGRKYANGQFSDQNRQDSIKRVLAVQNSARGPR